MRRHLLLALLAALLPNLPRVGETVPGYEVAVWHGVWAPAGMPLMGAEHASMSARDAHQLLQREYQKIIKESGIKAD